MVEEQQSSASGVDSFSAQPDLGLESTNISFNTSEDAFLNATNDTAPASEFVSWVRDAVIRNPALGEAVAGFTESEAGRREARSALFPTVDLAVTGRSSFARNFSNDPDNIVERARSRGRADATAVLDQLLFDFGAADNRIAAANNTLRAAESEIERQSDQIALDAINAWYQLYTYQHLSELVERLIVRQNVLKQAVETRISLGASAAGDVARIDSAIATSTAQSALYRRLLRSAEARFGQLFHLSLLPVLDRAPLIGGRFASADAVRMAALESPPIAIVEAQAEAARRSARASRLDTLPTVNAGVEAGRFGFLSGNYDYDVRGTVAMRLRLFGPGDARADQAEARADAREARAENVRSEVLRLATTAWTDLEAYREELEAAEDAYRAGLLSRQVTVERFRATRGTLFDVLDAESLFVSNAARFIETIAEHDLAHFVLLVRAGRLSTVLGIQTDQIVTDR